MLLGTDHMRICRHALLNNLAETGIHVVIVVSEHLTSYYDCVVAAVVDVAFRRDHSDLDAGALAAGALFQPTKRNTPTRTGNT